MSSSSPSLTSDLTWDTNDSSYNEELCRKVWLLHESFLQSHGYTLAYPSSNTYRAIFADSAHIPIKAPQDPFHPRADEAFWYIELDVHPLKEPEFVGQVLMQTPRVHPALDSRGRGVILKAVRSSSVELKVIQRLSTDPIRADARNHTIPVLDILNLGEWAIVVTPEWGFGHWSPCPSVKEYLEFSRQLFEGLELTHENGIVHGDIHDLNVVMNHQGYSYEVQLFDPFPRDFGPCGAKYAFIDFGESQLVHPGGATRLPADLCFHTETAAPELFKDGPVNMFCCDVYALGAVLRNHVEHVANLRLKNTAGLISIASAAPQYIQLIDAVTNDDPEKRPTATEVLAQIEKLLRESDSNVKMAFTAQD